ncbi:hypothetical protein HCQ94_04180 [Actinomyces sp. zg-332]|uniref:hypothetical protein n=1 Tax=Actinomyces sp. zg-332 TaxID=2708340 RepID=UPI001421E3C9|nr:hypothetical protein [Actinomyces sp. zg-332]QPK93794.1 hypothetical protein HCQ94_04180 [Actinomyces sp. zg-332]
MSDKENYAKISLIHKCADSNYAWWNDCVVYELPFPASKNDLELFSSSCHDLVQLGINTVLVRPSKIDFSADENFINNFINTFHRVGIKVIFQLSGPVPNLNNRFSSPFIDFEKDSHILINRAEIAIKNEVDGIDLGLIIEEDMDSELSVNSKHFVNMISNVKKIIESTDRQVIITASGNERYLNSFNYYLESNVIQHMRTDALVHAPFNAKVFLEKINESYALSDSFDYHCAWKYNLSNSLHENYPSAYSWSKTTENLENRISALQLLFLGLPGSVYVNYFDELALPVSYRKTDYATALPIAQKAFEKQRKEEFSPWKTYKDALLARAQYNMGLGTIASVSGFEWANENTLVLVCEHIYIVVNMSGEEITVPKEYELLVSSKPEIVSTHDTEQNCPECSILPPETTAWFKVQS